MADTIDKRRLLRFAWRLIPPGETVDLADVDLADAPAQPGEREAGLATDSDLEDDSALTEDELAKLRAEGAAACSELAERIARAWELRDLDAQRAAVRALLLRTARLGMMLAAMCHHPRESARFARLLVRHSHALTERMIEHAVNACAWLDYTHPETADLLLEAAHAGEERLGDVIAFALEIDDPDEDASACAPRFQPAVFTPYVLQRLGHIVETARSAASRRIALLWLTAAGPARAGAQLSSALGAPSLRMRTAALRSLMDATPPAVSADDVLALLEDLRDEPPAPLHGYDAMDDFAHVLQEATLHLRPDGGAEVLRDIVLADPIITPLGASWARHTLAGAYPDACLDLLDAELLACSSSKRLAALESVAVLPEHLARPRLVRAADDGSPGVAERARELWRERFCSECPAGPRPGVDPSLGSAQPSERMQSFWLVLRGASVEARHALARVLLREAPDPDALALLVMALADDSFVDGDRRLPRDREGWAKRLVQAFGTAGIAGLRALATKYPHAKHDGWMAALMGLATLSPRAKKGLRGTDRDVVREIACARLRATGCSERAYALRILSKTGGVAGELDLVWSLATEDDVLVRWEAAHLLEGAPPDGDLDGRVLAALHRAIEERDHDEVERLLSLAARRKIAGFVDAAERVLAIDEEGATDARVAAAAALEEAGRLSDGWLDEQLAHPEDLLFAVAARMCVDRSIDGPRARLLVAALASRARGGAAAAEAAATLLLTKEVEPTDPRVGEVLTGAGVRARAALLETLRLLPAPIALLEPHIERLVTAEDAGDAVDFVWELANDPEYEELLRRLLPQIQDDDLRKMVRGCIGSESYWADE